MEINTEIAQQWILRRGDLQRFTLREKDLLVSGCDLGSPKTKFTLLGVVMVPCYQTLEL